jgi:hypothetical protein
MMICLVKINLAHFGLFFAKLYDKFLLIKRRLLAMKTYKLPFASSEVAEKLSSIQKGGSKAFKIINVMSDGYVIAVDDLKSIPNSEALIGCYVSADCGNNYNSFAKINSVDQVNNCFGVDAPLTGYTIEEDSVIWIVGHPELGTVDIGEGAVSVGINNIAAQYGTFASGQDNIADGKRSFATGRRNYAGYGAAVVGQDNNAFGFFGLTAGDHNTIYGGANNTFVTGAYNQLKGYNGMANGEFNWVTGRNALATGYKNAAGGNNSFAGGEESETYKKRAFVFGKGLRTDKDGQTVFGDYNAPNARDVFQIGVGTDENHRANAFIVDANRNTIGGTNNNIIDPSNKFNVFMYGDNLWAQSNGESAIGRYNISTPQTVFTVGIGTADNARKNGLAVEKDGRVVIGADPVYSMDVATKQYVDSMAGGATYSAGTGINISKNVISVDTATSVSSSSTKPVTSKAVHSALSNKQDKLTAGTGVTISNNTISVSGAGGVTPAKYITNVVTQTAYNRYTSAIGTWTVNIYNDGTFEATAIVLANVQKSHQTTGAWQLYDNAIATCDVMCPSVDGGLYPQTFVSKYVGCDAESVLFIPKMGLGNPEEISPAATECRFVRGGGYVPVDFTNLPAAINCYFEVTLKGTTYIPS